MAAIFFSCKLKKCSSNYFSTLETGNFAIPFNLFGQAKLKMVSDVRKEQNIIYRSNISFLALTYIGGHLLFPQI